MVIKRISFLEQAKTLWALPALVVFIISSIGILAPAVSSAQSIPANGVGCRITGVPRFVTNGQAVTPTIVVINKSQATVNTNVSVIESLINHKSGKGGGDIQPVSVSANSRFQFTDGTLYAQTGYRIRITASSTSPEFTCKRDSRIN
jgi:hypothetical protein